MLNAGEKWGSVFFQAEDGIRDLVRSRGLGDVYKRQIEGLYLTLGSTGEKVDPKIAGRIAEQRHTLDNLIALLKQNNGSSALVDSLQDLATAYEAVKTEYTFVQPTLDAVNKTTYINSVSKAEVPSEALQTIIRKVRAIRSSIIA